jgi:hypothetical protein
VNPIAASRARVALILLAAVAIAIFFLVRSKGPLVLLGETSVAALACFIVALASCVTGLLALTAAARAAGDRAGVISLDEAFLTGVAAFGTAAGAVASVSVKPLPMIAAVLALAAIPLAMRGLSWSRPGLPGMLLVPAILLGAAEAISPASMLDELVYKLAVPHAYEMHGRMIELPLNSNSYLAMALQLADLPAMMMGGPLAAKLIHFLTFVAALAACYRLGRRFTERGAAWVAVTIAYTPALLITAGWAFSEWATVGLLAVSFARYAAWLESGSSRDGAIAFAAAGAAASIKYTALPWVAVFLLLILWRERGRARLVLRLAAIGALFGSFFYLRNAIWTGSPVAPMFLPDAPAVQNYRSGTFLSGWVDFFTGVDIFDKRISDEAMGILLPLAMIASLLVLPRRDRQSRDLLLIGAVQMAVLLTIGPGTRNMILGAVALAIPGAALIAETILAAGMVARALAGTIAAVILFTHLTFCSVILMDRMPYLTGSETAAQFLVRTRPFALPYAWIAANTRDDARILLLGETRTLYLLRQSVSGGNLDGARIANWLGQYSTPAALAAGLKAKGITHVLWHPAWYRVTSPQNPPVDMLGRELLLEVPPETDRLLRSFLTSHAQPRYRDAEYVVFELN